MSTLIHSSEEGHVALETSSNFHTPPQHPRVLSDTLMTQLLKGISQKQEKGMLQELFISDPSPVPVFSDAQITFLVPHLIDAFSKATREELIIFRSPGKKEGSHRVSGTMAVFSPSIFILTIQKSEQYAGSLSKMKASSRNLQLQTSLIFSDNVVVLPREEAQGFMKIPSKTSSIAINFAILRDTTRNHQQAPNPLPSDPTIPQQTESQPNLQNLREQVQDLRKTVDEQREEIQRIQQAPPQ